MGFTLFEETAVAARTPPKCSGLEREIIYDDDDDDDGHDGSFRPLRKLGLASRTWLWQGSEEEPNNCREEAAMNE